VKEAKEAAKEYTEAIQVKYLEQSPIFNYLLYAMKLICFLPFYLN
jgi:hypothetical protein